MLSIMLDPFKVDTHEFEDALYDRTFLKCLVGSFGRDLKDYCFLCPPLVIERNQKYVLVGRSWSYDVLLYHAGEFLNYEIPAILAEDEEEANKLFSVMERELYYLESFAISDEVENNKVNETGTGAEEQ